MSDLSWFFEIADEVDRDVVDESVERAAELAKREAEYLGDVVLIERLLAA